MNAQRIAEQIAQVDSDLADIDEQVTAGDLDEETAERLRSSYREERESLQRRLDEAPSTKPTSDEEGSGGNAGKPEGRSRGRAIAGTVIVAIAAVVVGVVAIVSLQEQSPAGEMTDGVATDVLEQGVMGGSGGGTDMSSVSAAEMEAIVEENPDVVGMRMALAEIYIEEGDLSSGLDHYMIVLDLEPENAEALTRVGWLTSVSGEPKLAEPFFERALAVEPDYPQAYWFLANVRLEMGDKDGAIKPLEALLTYEIPTEVRTEAMAMLAEARS